MPWQLIFTSVPSGFETGHSGFCTVARHPDMPGHLVRELERISSYAHLAAPGSENEDINPLIAAHRIWKMGNDRYHVLSRVQSAGVDFSRRSNHIAHHLVFEESEIKDLPTPAHILWAWTDWCKQWDKEDPRPLEDKDNARLSASEMEPPLSLPAFTWKRAAGKSRNAALLMERRVKERECCYVIVNLHHSLQPVLEGESLQTARGEELLLKLFEESLLLKKEPKDQWDVSFTTYLQSTDNPADFVWRGWRKEIPPPSEVESGAALAFDLTDPDRLPACDERSRKLVDIAQKGHSQGPAEPEPTQPDSTESTDQGIPAPPTSEAAGQQRDIEDISERDEQASGLSLTPRQKGDIFRPPQKKTPKSKGVADKSTPARIDWREPKVLWSAIGVAVLLIVVAIFGIRSFKKQSTAELQPPSEEQRVIPFGPEKAPKKKQKETTSIVSESAGTNLAVATPKGKSSAETKGAKPASTETATPQPLPAQAEPPPTSINVVMDGDDIGELLKSHFGTDITRDILSIGCDLGVVSVGDILPPSLPPPQFSLSDNGKVYDQDNALLFTLGPAGQPPLVIQAEKKNSNWFIRFSPRNNTPLSQTKKPAFTLLIWTVKDKPLLKWSTDRLEPAGGRFVIAGAGRQDLKRLRLNGGKVWLETQFSMPGSPSQPVKSADMDVSVLDYGKLELTFERFAKDLEDRLSTSRQSWSNALIQYKAEANAVAGDRRKLMEDASLNSACAQLFECVHISKATPYMFSNFWARSTAKFGKDLPEWGDYCSYLSYVCETYIAHRLGRKVAPVESTRIRNLFWDAQKKVWDPNRLSSVVSKKTPQHDTWGDLEDMFAREIKDAPNARFIKLPPATSKDAKNAAPQPEPYYAEEFARGWNNIFTSDVINQHLLRLLPQTNLIAYTSQIQSSSSEVRKLESQQQSLPKTHGDLTVVWLRWEVEKGKVYTLVEFKRGVSSMATASGAAPGAPGAVSPLASPAGGTR